VTDRVIVAITGASGAAYGLRALDLLRQAGIETHQIHSPSSRLTIPQETGRSVNEVTAMADVHYNPGDIAAPLAKWFP
jgi:4-hydroxy-3-polyprenylbenzoate decarboxylase